MITCPHCNTITNEGLFCGKCFGDLKQAKPVAETKQEIALHPKIALLRKKVDVVLKQKNLTNTMAKVALVLDSSGSMTKLYNTGVVQNTVERILAVASRFDDDGNLDVWFFADRFMRTPSITPNDFDGYVKKYRPEQSVIGGKNNEPLVMEDVFRKYTKEEPSTNIPAYIVFISDGGIKRGREIENIIIQSSHFPIFWQFVGIGQANFGKLEKLDELPGRYIDNANFFQLDDLQQISDEELYERLLNEFPKWLMEAKTKNVLR